MSSRRAAPNTPEGSKESPRRQGAATMIVESRPGTSTEWRPRAGMAAMPDDVARLKDAPAVFDCGTHAIHGGGAHAIFVGRVRAMRAERHGEPLLYCRGNYRALGISLGVPVDPAAPRQVLQPDGTVAPFIGLEPWF